MSVYASSAPRQLPFHPTVFTDLEQSFEAPVIELYGMTETAFRAIACNPLPPRPRKVGSVGVPVGLDVAIMDEGGAFVPSGQTGQIVVRGASITPGYYGDTWQRQPLLRAIGSRQAIMVFSMTMATCLSYGSQAGDHQSRWREIRATGNREVLLEHPAVAEAVTFAVPHRRSARTSQRQSSCGPTRRRRRGIFVSSLSGESPTSKSRAKSLFVDEDPKRSVGQSTAH